MEISKMLTISTAHVSEKTADLLENNKLKVVVYNKEDFGWFIHLDEDNLTNYYDSNDTESYFYVPEELLKLMKFAQDLGCDWLCLDCDGEELEYFDTFDW